MAAIKREWPFTQYEAEHAKRRRFNPINQEQDGDCHDEFEAKGQGFVCEPLLISSCMYYILNCGRSSSI
jgi:hypothetical protein